MMKTLLVPVDFSENSLDAVQYAFDTMALWDMKQVVLYHSNTLEGTPNETLMRELEGIIEAKAPDDKANVICIVSNDTLVEGISILTAKFGVSLIIMGITGRNKIGQKLIGSGAFQVSQTADIPVLIIPAKTRFSKMKNIALALPLIADLQDYIPYLEINSLVKALAANLMVVNVARKTDSMPKRVLYAGLKDMFEMFDELEPSYHFLTDQSTAETVAEFAKDNHADLLISIAGNYGFFQGMFKLSVTKKLGYSSPVPLLVYRQKLKTK